MVFEMQLLAWARRSSNDVHRVSHNSLTVKVAVPLPQGSGAVHEGQDSVTKAWFPER